MAIPPSTQMFQQRKHWNTGVVRRKGRDLEIEVSRPKDIGDEITFVVTASIMVGGYIYLFLSPLFRASSQAGLIAPAIMALLFGTPIFFLGRAIAEQDCGSQSVSITASTILWTRKTRRWKRQRTRNLDDVEDITALTPWWGLGAVRVTTKRRRRHTILHRIRNEDATRFARELKTTASRS